MARTITRFGITKVGLGTILHVNAENLLQLPSQGRVLGLIGESTGGAPGSVSGLVSVRDAAKASTLYGTGDLPDAIRIAFNASADANIPGVPSEVVIYKTNQSTQSVLNEYQYSATAGALISNNTAAAGSSTTSVVLTTNLAAPVTANSLVGYTVRITIASLSQTFTRRVTANTIGVSSTLTITPALPIAPIATSPVMIYPNVIDFKSFNYGLNANSITVDLDQNGDGSYELTATQNGQSQVSPSLGNTIRFKVGYKGGSPTISDTVAASSTATSINLTTGGLTPSAHVGKTVRVTTGGVDTFTIITANTASVLTVSPALPAAPVTGNPVGILNVTSAVGSFSGASGAPTFFVTSITGVTGDNLSIATPASMTLRQLVGAITANSNYQVTVPNGINPDSTMVKDFDFKVDTTDDVNIQASTSISTTGFKQDVADIVSWTNANSAYLVATRASTFALDGAKINVSAVPADFQGLQMYGAVLGDSTNSQFQAGLNAMLTRSVDQIVPLIDQDIVNGSGTISWAAISQQLLDNVIAGRTTVGLWRGGVMGFVGTKAQFIAAANSINDTDIQLVSQSPTALNVSGELVEYSPKQMAVFAASMRLGAIEVGTALTNKYLRTSGVTQSSTWNPADVTDAADLILNGCLFAENVPGKGTRWNRDNTTYVQDDNLAFTDGSVRDVVRFVAQGTINLIEERFIGQKATPATIASVKNALATLYEGYRSESIIVDSIDPITGRQIKAYHDLIVTSVGDVLEINVGIFPVPSINFAVVIMNLDLARQAA